RHAVHLAPTLRKKPAHDRAPAVHGRELVAEPQIAHALPPGERLDPRVQRLGFSHARPARDDDEVRGLEPGGLEVELREPGRDAGDVLLALVEALDVLEGRSEERRVGEEGGGGWWAMH